MLGAFFIVRSHRFSGGWAPIQQEYPEFTAILEAITRHPDARKSDLPPMADEQRRTLSIGSALIASAVSGQKDEVHGTDLAWPGPSTSRSNRSLIAWTGLILKGLDAAPHRSLPRATNLVR